MPQSPARLWEMYEEWRAGDRYGNERLFREHNDIYIVAPMVVYLGPVDKDPLDGLPYTDGKPRHNYTCKHHDAATGNCGIYEHRPQLCRDYPNGYKCRYEGCTAAKKEPIIEKFEASEHMKCEVGEQLAESKQGE